MEGPPSLEHLRQTTGGASEAEDWWGSDDETAPSVGIRNILRSETYGEMASWDTIRNFEMKASWSNRRKNKGMMSSNEYQRLKKVNLQRAIRGEIGREGGAGFLMSEEVSIDFSRMAMSCREVLRDAIVRDKKVPKETLTNIQRFFQKDKAFSSIEGMEFCTHCGCWSCPFFGRWREEEIVRARVDEIGDVCMMRSDLFLKSTRADGLRVFLEKGKEKIEIVNIILSAEKGSGDFSINVGKAKKRPDEDWKSEIGLYEPAVIWY